MPTDLIQCRAHYLSGRCFTGDSLRLLLGRDSLLPDETAIEHSCIHHTATVHGVVVKNGPEKAGDWAAKTGFHLLYELQVPEHCGVPSSFCRFHKCCKSFSSCRQRAAMVVWATPLGGNQAARLILGLHKAVRAWCCLEAGFELLLGSPALSYC